MVGWLVSSTTLSGHLCSDLIRIVVLSMSGRSGKLGGGSGKHQPAISRRTKSALPTTIKYLAMGTADSSRELSNRGHPMAAMLDHTHSCLFMSHRRPLDFALFERAGDQIKRVAHDTVTMLDAGTLQDFNDDVRDQRAHCIQTLL
jgi:hypothetical protein